MRTWLVFTIGLGIGLTMTTGMAQENRLPGVLAVNHIAITVDNLEETAAFYTQKMGFREAWVRRNDKGQLTLAFIQINRDSFLELSQKTPTQQAGITHFGLQVEDVRAIAALLTQRNVMIGEPRPTNTDATILEATAPGGLKFELTQFGPASPTLQAIKTWR